MIRVDRVLLAVAVASFPTGTCGAVVTAGGGAVPAATAGPASAVFCGIIDDSAAATQSDCQACVSEVLLNVAVCGIPATVSSPLYHVKSGWFAAPFPIHTRFRAYWPDAAQPDRWAGDSQ